MNPTPWAYVIVSRHKREINQPGQNHNQCQQATYNETAASLLLRTSYVSAVWVRTDYHSPFREVSVSIGCGRSHMQQQSILAFLTNRVPIEILCGFQLPYRPTAILASGRFSQMRWRDDVQLTDRPLDEYVLLRSQTRNESLDGFSRNPIAVIAFSDVCIARNPAISCVLSQLGTRQRANFLAQYLVIPLSGHFDSLAMNFLSKIDCNRRLRVDQISYCGVNPKSAVHRLTGRSPV
jgi:hypothetical protein